MSKPLHQYHQSPDCQEEFGWVTMPEVTITMDDDALTELKAEIGIKSIMEQLSPRHSIMERMAIGYLQATDRDIRAILIKKEIK